MAGLSDEILHAVRGRHPLLFLRTSEEERVVDCLAPLLARQFPGGAVTSWSCVRGLEPAVPQLDTRDPVAALQEIVARPRKGFLVMKDLVLNDPRVARALREAYFAFARDFQTCIVLVSPTAEIPDSLDKEIRLVELGAPTPEELSEKLLAVEAQYPSLALTATLRSQIVMALSGLTLKEAGHVMHRALAEGGSKGRIVEEIFAEKRTLARKAGFLEFIPVPFDISRIGGLENLKEWAAKRKGLFTEGAVQSGIPTPKGVLIMGVAGCGKSMLAKAISGLWKVPLFRLDMSLVFSGAYGSPETAFHRALRTIESMAPVVLWIDEMEAALSAPKDAGTAQSMCFSAFLTWMQEKPPLVFVAATANRIQGLPAEIIRKGRFDQVFFCDLPGKREREEIMGIHLEMNGAHPGDFDMDRLVARTEGWSGAEIEQAVIAGRIEAHQAGRSMSFEDVRRQCDSIVPLSTTMKEQVKAIRDWAHTRATRASKPDEE